MSRCLGGTSLTTLSPIRISPPLRFLEPGDHAQQRGLAAARRADQHGERAVGDVDVHAMQDRHFAEMLPDRSIVTLAIVAARDPKAARAAAIEHHLNGERRLITSGVIKPSRIPRR
jgi:hypothetical protein